MSEQTGKQEDETVVASAELVVDFDPAFLPCHLLSFYFYSLLAMNRSKP